MLYANKRTYPDQTAPVGSGSTLEIVMEKVLLIGSGIYRKIGLKFHSLDISKVIICNAASEFLLFFRHLNGCILEGKYFARPHLMITDAFNATYNQSRRRVRDEQLMSMDQ